MIVWITHVKVGHRQTPHLIRPTLTGGAFRFGRRARDLLERVTTRVAGCGAG